MTDVVVRQATHDDYQAIAAFTQETWAERGRDDYLSDVFHDWVDANGQEWRTVVVEVDGVVAGISQGKLLSDHEAWMEGMRIHPEYRGGGYGLQMSEELFDWARARGATVARNMVFGWNDAGLGQAMAAGFEPRTSFRWANLDPGAADQEIDVRDDPAAAWSYWARSGGRHVLGNLALDNEHSWALSELTRKRLLAMAEDERVLTVRNDGTTRGMTARVRTTELDTEDGTDSLVEYAVGAWTDAAAAKMLFEAVRADSDQLGVDSVRVLIPGSPRHVAEAAAARAELGDHCDYVMEADLA